MKQKSRRTNPAEICSFCGQQAARLYLKNHTFGQGDRMIVIESVPIFVCDNCHESYITAEVSRAIERNPSLARLFAVEAAEAEEED